MIRILVTLACLLGTALAASPASASTSTATFEDGASDYQKFMLSNPNVKVISVKAARNVEGDVVQEADGDELVVRRVTRSSLIVTYESID